MQKTSIRFTAALVVLAGLGLGLAAQQKPAPPAAGAKPLVKVYKSPT
jgi:hypothetical protein